MASIIQRLNIKRIINYTFIFVFIIFSIIVGTSRYFVAGIEKQTNKASDIGEIVRLATEIKFNIVQIQQFITDASLTGEEEGLKEAQDNLDSLKQNLDTISRLDPSLQKNSEAVLQTSLKVSSVGLEMFHAYIEKGKKAGDDIMKRDGTGLDALSEAAATEVNNLVSKVSTIQKEENTKLLAVERQLEIVLLILAAFTCIAMLANYMLIKKILNQIVQAIQSLGQSGKNIAVVGEEVAKASRRLSEAATQTAASIETTTASTEEIAATIKLNAQGAMDARQLSNAASTLSEKGQHKVSTLFNSISEISERSKKIEEIVTVIDDIAFQTNLLALNASVEAARAGEQGKGFAVVADAVRSLAQRSATSAKEISSLIHTSVEKINSSFEVAKESGETLSEIVTSVKKVSAINEEISSSSQQQSSGINSINLAMNELDRATQNNAASAEEAAAASQTMLQESSQLRSLLDQMQTLVGT